MIKKRQAPLFLMLMLMLMSLVMGMLWFLSGSRFANLGKGFLQSRHIGFVGIVGNSYRLLLHIKHNILDTSVEIFVKRNILHDLVAAVLAVQIDI